MTDINYGPLAQLIGTWKGDKGTDIAPDGEGNNPWFESIVFEAIDNMTNAQTLAVLHYKQIVFHAESGHVFHHQVGYWSWSPVTGMITHSFTIPRGVGVVACGKVLDDEDLPDATVIEVSSEDTSFDGGIAQTSFLQKEAKTTAFSQMLTIQGDTLKYEQTMMLDIDSNTYEDTDTNTLTRQAS